MPQFVSIFVNKLDTKFRVSVPASFRQILTQQNLPGFYALRSFVGKSIVGFPETLLTDLQERMGEADPFFDRDYDNRVRTISGRSTELQFDTDGRVRLPDDFIAHAEIKDRVLFVGLFKKFEMWNPDLYEAVQRESDEQSSAVYRASGGTL